jgi:tetratricopeptide (TPR) repeat protein
MKTVGHLVVSFGILLTTAFSQSIVGVHEVTALTTITFVVQGRNTIYGTVSGESNRPVADVYVELLDDFNSSISQTKTDGTGRFTFRGLVNGRYRVKALPYGTDYLEQTQEVTLAAVSATAGSGADTQHIEFYLKLNERAYAGPFSAVPGVIFVQDTPPAAKKLYEQGVAYLRNKKDKEAFDSLKKALEIFPDYYMALDRLGAEYAMRGPTDRTYLEAALLLLKKAVEINPRGFSSVYGLGWTQYQLRLNAEAIESFRRATLLYGKSADLYLWLGKALKRASTLDQAELAFRHANELAHGKAAEVHWQLAGIYSDQKRFKEAADELELFLKTRPKADDDEKIRAVIKQLREKAEVK